MRKPRLACKVVLVFALGCTGDREPPPTNEAPFERVRLQILVPERPGLMTWLEDQRGEWEARTGASVELVDQAVPGHPDPSDSDIVIHPAMGMGEVVDEGQVALLPNDLLADPDYAWKDVASTVRDQLAAWDRQPCAFPLLAGCPLVYYRKDLFADSGYRQGFEQQYERALDPPQTWDEFDELAAFFHRRDLDGDGKPDSSLAVADVLEAFLCRAAAYGKHSQNLSFYFDVSSMKPLLQERPFLQALQEWRKTFRFAARGDRSGGIDLFKQGRAAMAIGSSLLAPALLLDRGSRVADKTACVPIPGSRRVYDHGKSQWTEVPRGNLNTASLVDGWLASVRRSSLHPDAAFHFLAYLTDPEQSLAGVAAPEFNLGPYRLSHLGDPSAWAAANWPAGNVRSWLSAVELSLTASNAVAVLRIEGAAEYHWALEEQLRRALRDDIAADQALADAAQTWQTITARRGADRMRRQYRRSLGMPVID